MTASSASPDARTLTAPSAADFEAIAREVLAELADTPFGPAIADLLVRVDDFCDEEIEREMELESPFDLLGLYSGVSIDRQSVHDVRTAPDMVFLYRRPILDYWCESGEDLHHVVRHVLIHEIGHHLGFSDDDMEEIEGAD
ncbi:metallopeptidase family protein [Caenispirillum bisanense]|uniref:Predicted Zn-dependent protease, minimal metalloprotease (MMP)-like domain n=1 Tax=Caenispirillum bisanense TaxID=414052 RepID=A0A286G8U1_9PROT|nr:metallopeptidase family protein [Caenispirillum bisanense]SOD91963.1 Predicted Zn-dependent protease, minimal metalloprotease (MMP)-like domain [Caenispirillum bisanense]